MKRVGSKLFFVFLVFALSFSLVSAADEYVSPVSVWAESAYSTTYSPEKAADGNTNTGWFSKANPTFPVSIYFDFGEDVVLSGFDFYAYYYYIPINFNVYVSSDNSTWDLVLEDVTVSEGGEYVRFDFDDVYGLRYLQIEEVSTKVSTYAGAVYEFRGVLGEGTETEVYEEETEAYEEETEVYEEETEVYEEETEAYEEEDLGYIIEEDFGNFDYDEKELVENGYKEFYDFDFQGRERGEYSSNYEESFNVDVMKYSENISFAVFHEYVKKYYDIDEIDYENMGRDDFSMSDDAQILIAEDENELAVIWTSDNYFVSFKHKYDSSPRNSYGFEDGVFAYLNKYKTSLVIDKDVYECSRDYDCPVESESYCADDYSLYTSTSYFNCENSKCVSPVGSSDYEYCQHGCVNDTCVEKVYPKRSLDECSDLIEFIKTPYSFEDDDGSVWRLNWNNTYVGDYFYIDNERYFADRYWASFSYDRYDSDYEFEGWVSFDYEVYSFQSNVSDVIESVLNDRVNDQLCSPYVENKGWSDVDSEEEGLVYYLCDESALYELNALDDYSNDYYSNQNYGSIVWISGNNLFVYRVNYAEYRNYYDRYFDDDSDRYLYEISQEINSVERAQEKTLSFLSKLVDNEAKSVDVRNFYYNAPWILRGQLEEDKGVCSSDIKDNEDICVPYWECMVSPVVCPEHGYQTSKCVDVNECFDTKETRQNCNPGICSGCTMNKWLGFGWSELYTKCMPYGARFDFAELMKGEDKIPGGVSGDSFDYMEVVVLNDYSAKIYTNNSMEGYREYSVYENNELNLGGAESIYIKDVIYDESMEGKGEIIFTITNEYNAYCDYDGRIKEQKLKDYDGSWATCQNNFECYSNLCSSGECIEIVEVMENISGFKEIGIKLLCSFANMFGIQQYDSCIAENLGGSSNGGGSSGGGSGSSGGSSGGSGGSSSR